MESPIIEDRLRSEDLVTGTAIQPPQLRANVLKLADGMRRREFVELVRDIGDVERHQPRLPLLSVDDSGPGRRTSD
jgi:hypothetical protein